MTARDNRTAEERREHVAGGYDADFHRAHAAAARDEAARKGSSFLSRLAAAHETFAESDDAG